MVANFHGHAVDMVGLRGRFGMTLTGATLRDLMDVAGKLGFGARALRVPLNRLNDIATPAVLHWDLNHFVVLERSNGKHATIFDPASGRARLAFDELSRHFTGVALELTPTTRFQPIESRVRAKLSDFWSRSSGLRRALIQTLMLSVILQVIALLAPYYLQLVIDEVVPSFDRDFLLILALGFGALYLIRAFTEWLRGWVILNYGQHMTLQMAGNLVHHLIRLPADFFEKRHVGDIISRLKSVTPIQRALTQGLVAALIDGLMAVTTAIVMLVYDARLALLAFGFIAVYVLISVGTVPLRRRLQEAEIAARADENSQMIETIRAARTIKQFGRESIRENAWRNLFANLIEKSLSVGRLDLIVQFFQTLLWGLQVTLIVYFATLFILDGELTVGALFAFTAYRQHFVERVQELISNVIEFRMLKLHLERLADIVYTPREQGLDGSSPAVRTDPGRIELKQVSFRYGPHSPYVFRNLSLIVEPRAFVAITGPSGSGKSTLLKLLLGLVPAEQGDFLAHDIPVSTLGLQVWRSQVGAVMQDDQLLSGSIADNIAFFDPEADLSRVQQSAQAANIHHEIMSMPMNYMSLVGDMGSALSGGQRQRVLLARALYRQPRVLFLDEGTANLDLDSELQIAETIRRMPITRIVIAHRPALLDRADKVFVMAHGRLAVASG